MPKVQVFDYIELMFDYIELMRFCLFSCKAFRHATKPKTQTPPPGIASCIAQPTPQTAPNSTPAKETFGPRTTTQDTANCLRDPGRPRRGCVPALGCERRRSDRRLPPGEASLVC
jgi:hypothetical protein